MLKTAPKATNPNFFAFTHKSNNYCCVYFLLKGGPPWTFILWMNKNKIFSNPLVSGTKKRGPQSNCCFGGPFLRVFSPFAPRGNNFFTKIFLIKVCHSINEHLEHIWFSLMLTLWCLGQKERPPKQPLLWGPLFEGIFPLCTKRE